MRANGDWSTGVADNFNCITDKIRTNSEYWYERLGIKRKLRMQLSGSFLLN